MTTDRTTLLASLSTPEKIETVVLCYLRGAGTTRGACGELVEFEPGRYRVTADGRTFIVYRETIGWCVHWKGFQGVDSELYCAARNYAVSL